VILLTAPFRRLDWAVLPETFKSTIFLLALVTSASMMPVETLPSASWSTAFGLGFVSAVFDNIPLTALALRQGAYDCGFLAYAVGFGGSILVWIVSRRRLVKHVSGSEIGEPVAASRLAYRRGLCDRLLRDACGSRMASMRITKSASMRLPRRRPFLWSSLDPARTLGRFS
jgi:hypothetical protein